MMNKQLVGETCAIQKKPWITPELMLFASSDINAGKNRAAYNEASYQNRVFTGRGFIIMFDKGNNPVPAAVTKASYNS